MNFSQLKTLFWVISQCFKKILSFQRSLLSQEVGGIGKSSVSLKYWRRSFGSSCLPSVLLDPLASPATCWPILLPTTDLLLPVTVMFVDCASISAGHKVAHLLGLLTHLHYWIWKCSAAFSALPYLKLQHLLSHTQYTMHFLLPTPPICFLLAFSSVITPNKNK